MIQIYLINSPKVTDKIAGFDYDWILVHPKDGKIFPKDVNDWVWMFENIQEILKDYYDKGYTIVIFTNQSKVWKLEQLQESLKTLQIPLFIVCAYASSKEDKKYYKPNTLMFRELIKGEYNKKLSFFVGDALGRPSDFSDSDKVFAEKPVCQSSAELAKLQFLAKKNNLVFLSSFQRVFYKSSNEFKKKFLNILKNNKQKLNLYSLFYSGNFRYKARTLVRTNEIIKLKKKKNQKLITRMVFLNRYWHIINFIFYIININDKNIKYLKTENLLKKSLTSGPSGA